MGEAVDKTESFGEEAEDVSGGDITSGLGDSETGVDDIDGLGNGTLAEFLSGRAHCTAVVGECRGAIVETKESGGALAWSAGKDALAVDKVAR